MKKFVLTLLLTTAFSAATLAQNSKWTFGAMTEGMYNFSPQNTYELTGNHDRWACATATVALKGGYTGSKFNATLKLTGSRDWSNIFEDTDEFLAELFAEDDDNDIWKKGYNEKRDSSWRFAADLATTWNISPRDKFVFNVNHNQDRKIGSTINTLYEIMHEKILHVGVEHFTNYTGSTNFKTAYTHTFRNNAIFKTDISVALKTNDKASYWDVLDDKLGLNEYTTEPIKKAADFRLDLRYQNKEFLRVKNLDTSFGFLTDNHHDDDNYKSMVMDQETDEWHEDPSYNRIVDYTAFTYGPFIEAAWKYKGFDLKAYGHLQLFNRLMSENEHPYSFGWSEPEMILNTRAGWDIGKGHKLSVGFRRTAARPTYDQINPFDLPGSKSDEVIRGNKKLNAAISNLPDLSYNFTYKRFSFSLGSELKLARHEIESTVQVDTVFDLKIKTWVNSKSSETLTLKTGVQWKGQKLKAEASFSYRFYQAVLASGKTVPDRNFSTSGKISYELPWQVKISADVAYSSPARKAYTLFSEHVTLNARVDKTVGKFKFWISGLNLLDKAVEKLTYNEKTNFIYMQTNHLYRRKLLVGLSYNF